MSNIFNIEITGVEFRSQHKPVGILDQENVVRVNVEEAFGKGAHAVAAANG